MAFALQYYALDPSGKKVMKSIPASVEIYKEAADKGMTLRQYARHLAPDCDYSMGEPLDQMYTYSGLFDHTAFGMPAMTLDQLASAKLSDGFRRPDGSDNSLGARLLYPQLILETLNANAMRDDGSDILSIWEEMIAVSRNVNGTKAEQPIIDTSGPEESRSGRVAQLAMPETMISITTGDKSFRIPTHSVGLMISNEAMASTTIDLVRIVMEAQARGNRIRNAKEQLFSMVYGNIDTGMAPLPVTKISAFDPSITTNGVITKRAFIKWLHSMENFSISHALTSIDTALDIDEGLFPKQPAGDASKIATPWGGLDLGIQVPKVVPFKPEDFGAGVIVGLDARYGVQRFVNVSASYEAVEEYVMRKATAFRVDYGEMATRLMDEAWSVVSLEA